MLQGKKKEGNAAKFVIRSQALKQLQISLPLFRLVLYRNICSYMNQFKVLLEEKGGFLWVEIRLVELYMSDIILEGICISLVTLKHFGKD